MTSELLLWLALGACAGKPPSPVDETGVPDTPPDTDTGGSVDSGRPCPTLPVTVFVDADGDGYGAMVSGRPVCEPDAGAVVVGGDCDDTDPAIHPGVPEVWSDGIDQDCSGYDECGPLGVYSGDYKVESTARAGDLCAAYDAVSGALFLQEDTGIHNPEPLDGTVDLSAFACLCRVGAVGVMGLDDFETFEGIPAAAEAFHGSWVWSVCNPNFRSFAGLEGVRELYSLDLTSCNDEALDPEPFRALSDLVRVGALDIFAGVESLVGLDQLEEVEYVVYFRSTRISDLTGLASLRTIGDTFNIYDFGTKPDTLVSFEGLESLESIGGVFDLTGVSVVDFTTLPGTLSEVGGLELLECDELVSMVGFEGIRINGSINLEGNDRLEALDVPLVEAYVPGSIVIWENPSLAGVEGLSEARIIEGDLSIYDNDALCDLTPLYGVEEVWGYLEVSYNGCISNDDARALVAAIGEENIYGGVFIGANG